MQNDTIKEQVNTALSHVDEAKAKLEAFVKADSAQTKADAQAAIAKLQEALKNAKAAIG